MRYLVFCNFLKEVIFYSTGLELTISVFPNCFVRLKNTTILSGKQELKIEGNLKKIAIYLITLYSSSRSYALITDIRPAIIIHFRIKFSKVCRITFSKVLMKSKPNATYRGAIIQVAHDEILIN